MRCINVLLERKAIEFQHQMPKFIQENIVNAFNEKKISATFFGNNDIYF